MIPTPHPTDHCPECGAVDHGPLRPFGGHYSFCAYFSAAVYLEDQRAENAQWAAEAAEADLPPSQDDPT